MGLLDKLKGITANGAANLVEKIGDAGDKLFSNREELTTLINSHTEKMLELQIKEVEIELKDIDSARQMQIEALKQGDLFSKRFIYYLAIGYILFCFFFASCFFFVHYPPENRDIINMLAGVLISTGLVSVLGFFFGSSKGSSDKQNKMDSMVDKMINK
jgi:hypothetical protein